MKGKAKKEGKDLASWVSCHLSDRGSVVAYVTVCAENPVGMVSMIIPILQLKNSGSLLKIMPPVHRLVF